jgi:hypothetical protein
MAKTLYLQVMPWPFAGYLFHYLTSFISKQLDFIKPNFRLKKFIYRFMVVPAKWIRRGRQDILKLYTDKKYHLLLD